MLPQRSGQRLRVLRVFSRLAARSQALGIEAAALPSEGAVLRVFFGLWVSGQMKLRRIKGYRGIGGKEVVAA